MKSMVILQIAQFGMSIEIEWEQIGYGLSISAKTEIAHFDVLSLFPDEYKRAVLAQSKSHYAPPSGADIITDLVVLRPTYLVSTIVGAAFFTVSLPFTILGRNADRAAQKLVLNPAKLTFSLPLGDYETMALWPFEYDRQSKR